MREVTGNSKLQSEVLEDLSDARRYRRWLADLARPYLGPDPVEIGSGTGDYALEWVEAVDRFTATEADAARHRALAERFAGHDTIRVQHLQLGNPASENDPGNTLPDPRNDAESSGHSAAVAINVLEHIPDHVSALRAMAAAVCPGGAVIVLVPAFPSAMSEFDRNIGHQRRYTRASLRAALAGAGLAVDQLRYVNPIGLLGWYVTVKALRMTPRNGAALRAYDRLIVPLARAADRLPMPFGQSVFAVARVPGSNNEAPGSDNEVPGSDNVG